MSYDYRRTVVLSKESAKVLEDLFRKRNTSIKAHQNDFLSVKHSFDERKSLFQIFYDLEKEYKQISEKIAILESEIEVQKYVNMLNFINILLSEKNVLNEEINIDGLLFEINLLLDEDNVIEYIFLKKRLENIENELFSVRENVIKEITKNNESILCPHPLYAALDDEAYCVLCQKKLKFHHDDFSYLQRLIKSKRLIADVDYHVASYSTKARDVFYKLKEIVLFDEVSSYYRKLYNNRKELLQDGTINEDYSLEDYVWDYFCSERKTVARKYKKSSLLQ